MLYTKTVLILKSSCLHMSLYTFQLLLILPIFDYSECFHAYFRNTRAGATGPSLENLFICMRIKGNMVILTKMDASTNTSHQGRLACEFIKIMLSLIESIMGVRGLKNRGMFYR